MTKYYKWLRKWARRLLAHYRLNLRIVCEESAGLGPHNDYHDYPDESEIAGPIHFYLYTCERCGKQFTI